MDDATVDALLKEVEELPDENRTLLSHNERVLIEFCRRLGKALDLARQDIRAWEQENRDLH